ncbi:MAG: phage terminase family protein [Micrococcales bacterium]|nr:phage terminase family protein [Micrococcales bacterium]
MHTGALVLTTHVLNARRRTNASGYGIYKQHPDSPDKIDAAVAAVLAWTARLDAVAAGATQAKPAVPIRVR